jgi:hypothetical protein
MSLVIFETLNVSPLPCTYNRESTALNAGNRDFAALDASPYFSSLRIARSSRLSSATVDHGRSAGALAATVEEAGFICVQFSRYDPQLRIALSFRCHATKTVPGWR